MTPTGEWWVTGTIRVALALYVAALLLRLCDRRRIARLAWSLGFLALVVHVLAAFHFAHQWSHDDAYAVTARRTAETVGISAGVGLYLNYLLVLVWGADVALWWLAPRWVFSRSFLSEAVLQGFLAFMIFNATVVFGSGWIRWAGWVGTLVLGATLVNRRGRPSR